jgi:hypothetical protein
LHSWHFLGTEPYLRRLQSMPFDFVGQYKLFLAR